MRRFRELAAPELLPVGWLIGVLVRLPDQAQPVRHFWAVGMADRARAEWAAAKLASATAHIQRRRASAAVPIHPAP